MKSMEYLKEKGVSFNEIHLSEIPRGAQDVERLYGCPLHLVFKTFVFVGNNGAVLVGVCYTDLGEESERKSGYFDDPWQWEKIRKNAKWIIQFASTDDPSIPIKEVRYVQAKLNTEYHEYSNQGYMGADVNKLEASRTCRSSEEEALSLAHPRP